MRSDPRATRRLLLLSILVIAWSCGESSTQTEAPGAGTTMPEREVAAELVGADDLLAHERYWPYRVALTQPLAVPGREQPLPIGFTGVLIRVEESGLPRIDFSTRGKLEVPLEKTDLLERANRIRAGALKKSEPNFVHAIKSRLLDSEYEILRPLPIEATAARPGFLCVFADPGAEGFDDLARALLPLRDRHQVMTILFAQGDHPDPQLRERLRTLGWTIPFVFDFLSEPYTLSLLAEGATWPHVMLQTAEGRVLSQGPWRSDTTEFVAALDAEFGSGGDDVAASDVATAR